MAYENLSNEVGGQRDIQEYTDEKNVVHINPVEKDIKWENQEPLPRIMERVAGAICTNYCKWPERYESGDDGEEKLLTERCENCPLSVQQ